MKKLTETFYYKGLSYNDASKRALEVCEIASNSGQTVLAAKHLTELAQVMEIRK